MLQAFHQQPRVTLVELDVGLSGGAGFKANGAANHERDRLGFSFAYELGGARAGRVAYPVLLGPGRVPSQRAPRRANFSNALPSPSQIANPAGFPQLRSPYTTPPNGQKKRAKRAIAVRDLR